VAYGVLLSVFRMNPRQKPGLNMAVDAECTTKTEFLEKMLVFGPGLSIMLE